MSSNIELEPVAVINNFYINIENYVATPSNQPFKPVENKNKIIDEEFLAVIEAELPQLCGISL